MNKPFWCVSCGLKRQANVEIEDKQPETLRSEFSVARHEGVIAQDRGWGRRGSGGGQESHNDAEHGKTRVR